MKENYVQALLQSIEVGVEPRVALQNLMLVQEKRGHMKLYRGVLQSTLRFLEGRAQDEALVTVTDNSQYDSYKSEIESQLAGMNITTTPAVQINSNLIGGYILESKSQRVDASYKQKLVSLYQKITQ
ncbi:hypothetical protein CL653_01450 [bacterium]|nr:hypothetical protein [bacterium]|tara:strand:+ start:1519 stop:1899 length:381 start_codon:yes stop_codon:yes gene_type:complete